MIYEKTIACPICGKPYMVFNNTVANQSACPQCIEKAQKNMNTGNINWKSTIINKGQ